MDIGILSDIHVDINFDGEDLVTSGICKVIKNRSLDLLIIAGDVASDYKTILKSLNTIEKETEIPVLYIPGNHDIWVENYPDKTSWDLYEILKEYDHNLAGKPFPLGRDWIVIGDIGWYDFTFGDPKYSFEDFSRMQYEDRIWQDSIKAVWGRSTLDMHKYFLDKLEDQIKKHSDKNIILVTHVLPVREFTVQPPDPMWEYLNAFLGSREYGELALRYPNIKYSISGHVHYRRNKLIGDTEFICQCLGYKSEWFENSNPEVEVEKAMKVITINTK